MNFLKFKYHLMSANLSFHLTTLQITIIVE